MILTGVPLSAIAGPTTEWGDRASAQQDRDVVRALIRRDQIRSSVRIQVGRQNIQRAGSNGMIHGCGESPSPLPAKR